MTTPPEPETRPSVGGKLGILVALMRRPQGATIYALAEATGWQLHSVRGALAGSLKRQRGFNIVSEKAEGQDRLYRIPPDGPPPPTRAKKSPRRAS